MVYSEYSLLKKNIKKGSVLMIENTNRDLYTKLIAGGIKLFTGCKYHHAAIVAYRTIVINNNTEKQLWVYEAVANGFVPTMTVTEWLEKAKTRYNVVVFNTKLPNNTVFNERLFNITGTPYDFGSLVLWQVIYQISERIFKTIGSKRKVGIWLGKKGQKALNSIYCTEGVAYILGMEEWWTYDPRKLYDTLLHIESRDSPMSN